MFFINISCFSFAQSNYDINTTIGLQLYLNVKAFNNLELKLESNYSHQLDSAFTSTLSGRSSKFVYINEKERDISTISKWDMEEEKWVPENYNVFHFENDRLIRQTFNTWFGDIGNFNETSPSIIRNYIYDSDNKLIELQSSSSILEAENGRFNVRRYVYDQNEYLYRISDFVWSESENGLVLVDEFKYLHRENLLSTIVRYKNLNQSCIQDSIIFNYNDMDEPESEFRYGQGNDPDSLRFLLKRDFFYNIDGSLSLIEERDRFEEIEKIIYRYHPYGSLNSIKKIDDEDPDFIWGLTFDIYQHDENILVDKIKFPRMKFTGSSFDFAHYYEKHMLLKDSRYLGGGNLPLELQLETEYFYSEIEPSSIETFDSKNSYVFPNPTSSSLNLKIDKIRNNASFIVYNLIGELILEKSLFSEDHLIDVSSLTNGLYFYKIQSKDESVSGQFVVQK